MLDNKTGFDDLRHTAQRRVANAVPRNPPRISISRILAWTAIALLLAAACAGVVVDRKHQQVIGSGGSTDGAQALLHPRQPRAGVPPAIERLGITSGAPYSRVRHALIGAGFTPAVLSTDECAAAGGTHCGYYPELGTCSGKGARLCTAAFVAPDYTAYTVITAGSSGMLVGISRQDERWSDPLPR